MDKLNSSNTTTDPLSEDGLDEGGDDVNNDDEVSREHAHKDDRVLFTRLDNIDSDFSSNFHGDDISGVNDNCDDEMSDNDVSGGETTGTAAIAHREKKKPGNLSWIQVLL